MKIGIDARCLTDGKKTGVEEYTLGFLNDFLKEGDGNHYYLFINSLKKNKQGRERLKKFKHLSNVSIREFHFPNKLLNFSMWFFNWPKLDLLLGGVDIFIMPNISFFALSTKCKLILTVHDLSFEYFPEFFSFKRRLWHFLVNPRKICRRADNILAVSTSTKNDLIMRYGIKSQKIKLITPIRNISFYLKNKISEERKYKVRKKYALPKKFILFLGTIEPRKNLINLIKAFELFKKHSKEAGDYYLVLAGQLGWEYKDLMKIIKLSEFKNNIIFIDYVSQKDKPELYSLAKLFVYPSFFEGFGFPVVEAFASGTAVITSHSASLPEVVEDKALLIDPYRPGDIYLAIKMLIEDKKLRKIYEQAGKVRAKEIDINSKQNYPKLSKIIFS